MTVEGRRPHRGSEDWRWTPRHAHALAAMEQELERDRRLVRLSRQLQGDAPGRARTTLTALAGFALAVALAGAAAGCTVLAVVSLLTAFVVGLMAALCEPHLARASARSDSA